MKTQFNQEVVEIRQVAKVTKGGKNIHYRATVVIGNNEGLVGVGVGSAILRHLAVEKGANDAKNHIVPVPRTPNYSVPFGSHFREGPTEIIIRPLNDGAGVVAGGSVRSVLELSGYRNISAKNIGSPNKLQNARVCIQALNSIRSYYDKEKIDSLKLEPTIYYKVRKTGIKYVGQLLESIDNDTKLKHKVDQHI
jgi:small subunit ribosomal protein S5